jgi:tetratricopeptide (TPR) repeat protein
MKLSLCLILKDEKEHLKRILNKYLKYFDEVVVAYDDDSIKEFLSRSRSKKIKAYRYEWSDEEKKFGGLFFDKKRNFAASKVTGDYYFRLDADDVIINPQYIRRVAEKAETQRIAVVYCWYNYSRDNWGNVHAGHYRETIVKKDDNLFWNKPIHENIIPRSHVGHQIVIEEAIVIDHLMTIEHAAEAATRNIKYLIYEYEKDGEKTDPRTIAYLGRMMYSIGENDKAQYFLEKHIEKSGWDEDRYMSWCSLAEISMKKGKSDDALGCCFEAISEMPDRPDAYLKLHDIYFEKGDWRKAIYWGKLGLEQPKPRTFMLQDPSSYTWRPAISMAHCYLMMDDPDTAKSFFEIAEKAAPTLDWIVSNK